jgi:hypothetical protein
LTDGAVFPGEVNGTIVSGNNLARLNPKIEVAPKSKEDDAMCVKERNVA